MARLRAYLPYSVFAAACVAVPLTALAAISHHTPSNNVSDELTLSAISAQTFTSTRALPPLEVEREVRLQNGEALVDALRRVGLSRSQSNDLIASVGNKAQLNRLRAGMPLTVRYQEGQPYDIQQAHVSLRPQAGHELKLAWENGQASSKLVKHQLQTVKQVAVGRINRSLYMDATDAGLPAALVKPFVDLFAWDIDYTRDVRRGDTFKVVYEDVLDDRGQRVKAGRILAASFSVGKQTQQAFWFVDQDGRGDYYNEKGEGKRKLLLRTPLETYRISSHFNPNRKHPISGFTRAHKGTDFAAPTGTPVQASGDGTVTFAGRNGGYGNFIKITHNGTFTTAYAHLHRIQRGIRKGARVQQGQIIGTVGSTGASTGPHLHYEVIKRGVHVNAMRTDLPTGTQVAGKAKRQFLAMVGDIRSQWAKALTQLAAQGGNARKG